MFTSKADAFSNIYFYSRCTFSLLSSYVAKMGLYLKEAAVLMQYAHSKNVGRLMNAILVKKHATHVSHEHVHPSLDLK